MGVWDHSLSMAITITHAWLTPNPSNIRNGLPGLIVEEDTQSDMPLKFTGQKQFVLTSLDELGEPTKLTFNSDGTIGQGRKRTEVILQSSYNHKVKLCWWMETS